MTVHGVPKLADKEASSSEVVGSVEEMYLLLITDVLKVPGKGLGPRLTMLEAEVPTKIREYEHSS
jgi:hypothetical protein